MRRRWSAVLGLGALVGGCYDGFDPLDPQVLAEVMRSRGDAQGEVHSGIYVGTFEPLECGCSEIDERFDVTLCRLLERAEEMGLGNQLDVELVQADGTVRAQGLRLAGSFTDEAPLLPVLYGPLWADGQITAAGVLQADSIIVRGQVLGRFDGTVEGEAGTDVLEVEYQQRYRVDVIGDAELFGEPGEVIQEVDCRERIGLSLEWFAPPFTFPLDGG